MVRRSRRRLEANTDLHVDFYRLAVQERAAELPLTHRAGRRNLEIRVRTFHVLDIPHETVRANDGGHRHRSTHLAGPRVLGKDRAHVDQLRWRKNTAADGGGRAARRTMRLFA